MKGEVFRRAFGGVEELVLEVEKVAEAQAPDEKKIKIDTTRGWTDTGIDLVAGQTVQITATGLHCLPGGLCTNADGEKGIIFQEDLQEDGALPPVHAGQLAALIGDDVYPVGRGSQIKVKAGGRMLLGVATSAKASSGSLTATIQVFYPLLDR